MNSHKIPRAALPVTVQDKHGSPLTEKFSQKFGEKLSNGLLKEFGAIFRDTDGNARAIVDGCDREICEFCSFLVNMPDGNPLASLSQFDLNLFNDYINHLKHKFPTKHTKGKTTHPWERKWGALRARLSSIIAKEKFPYVEKNNSNKTDGHTPFAMGLMLDNLRSEIDRFRGKLIFADDGTVTLKWFDLAKRGRVLTHEQLEAFFPGRTSILTSEQLDALERAIFEPDRRTNDQLAAEFGMTFSGLYALKHRWVAKGRLNGRPKPKFSSDDLDLTIEDIIATIAFYLPDWPATGWLRLSGTNYRVYRSEAGILHGVYQCRKEAVAVAKEIDGVVLTTHRDSMGRSGLNPAETLFISNRHKNSILGEKIKKNLPGGISSLMEDYFPTTYDWTIIYLYWLILTGWNPEAIRSINRLDVMRQIKNGGPNELLSKEHATFTVEIEENEEDGMAELTGEKERGQPQSRPKLYTHVSDRTEQYGLFRVLEDYCKLTDPFVKFLSGDDVNRVLFGFSMASQTTFSMLARHANLESGIIQHKLQEFFKRNSIYEDDDRTQRITNTTARQLRVTYFTTLRSLNVPITTLVFLAGHESVDTHLVHYSSGQHGTRILREKARKLLNVVADKAFSGTLTPYTQPDKKDGSKTVRAFTHRNNPFMLCANPYAPSWPDHEAYLEKRYGKSAACDHFEMCLLCDQCQVTEDTLPFLVRWLSDLHEWRRAQGGGNFPFFMYRRHQAIREVFELCEADEYWRARLRDAEVLAGTDEFDAPPIWRSI